MFSEVKPQFLGTGWLNVEVCRCVKRLNVVACIQYLVLRASVILCIYLSLHCFAVFVWKHECVSEVLLHRYNDVMCLGVTSACFKYRVLLLEDKCTPMLSLQAWFTRRKFTLNDVWLNNLKQMF